MEAAYSADAAVFSRYLAGTGRDFLLLDAPDNDQVHVRFTGRFQGAEVVWDCSFVTLKSELRRCGVPAMRCFIDIGPAGQQGVPVRVGLNLQRIEHPDILKMMIMIRNYKRLHPGRQEFGEQYPPDNAD